MPSPSGSITVETYPGPVGAGHPPDRLTIAFNEDTRSLWSGRWSITGTEPVARIRGQHLQGELLANATFYVAQDASGYCWDAPGHSISWTALGSNDDLGDWSADAKDRIKDECVVLTNAEQQSVVDATANLVPKLTRAREAMGQAIARAAQKASASSVSPSVGKQPEAHQAGGDEADTANTACAPGGEP